jgi:molybdopterin molybdotransferase/putative molybdopterin biosynthesis protein
VQRCGAEIRRGTVVLRQGERLTPQRIGLALALGLDRVDVMLRPRVALIAPGDELLPPGAAWQPGKKWCSNLYALDIRVQELGGTSLNLGIVPDTLASLSTQLRRGLESDVVVILGASGRGDHDFAARAMAAIGAEMVFRGVATSPGRSVTVARWAQTLIVGLPGSPWAAFVGFEVFVWPILRAMLSQRPVLPRRQIATLATPLQVRPGVTSFLPACLQPHGPGWLALPIEKTLELVRAESYPIGLIVVPPHRRRLLAGSRVRLQPLTPW